MNDRSSVSHDYSSKSALYTKQITWPIFGLGSLSADRLNRPAYGWIRITSDTDRQKFSSERGDKPALRAQPYSSQRWERLPSHG